MDPVESLDRRLGRMVREWLSSIPGGHDAATVASETLAPAFTALVAGLLLRDGRRSVGAEAAVAALSAAALAKVLRDGIGRPRPGERSDGGFPSRHAAAAVAIVRAVGRRHPTTGRLLVPVAVLGLAGRVATAQHDPGDIVAGAALGWYVDAVVARVADVV